MLLDDELPGLTYLKMLCEQMPELEVVKAFNDPMKLLKESAALDFDLCILDIEMPGINGLELVRLLKNKPVIFVTAYKEYAAEAYDLEAVDYIRKPVQQERLQKAVEKAAHYLRAVFPEKTFLQVNSDRGKTVLFFDRIAYITVSENDKRDKKVYLRNGQDLLIKNLSLERLLEQLPAERFCRINKRDIIALKTLLYFSHDEAVIQLKQNQDEEVRLPLGDAYRSRFLRLLQK
ncbi:LytTR family DNA-binding domain-containing protein [Compostibacter hankyongensis]|uniref:LytTR family DNA-binding domain-containing protein n=1 Tax=Compostibacter hankyongensis TaxID=1007089 RepID=A0ABP8FPC2_9BACT